MSALSMLIKKVTKRQFSICVSVEQLSTVLDRTIAFAEASTPYLSEEDVAEIAAVIPTVEPADEADESTEADTQDADATEVTEGE